MGLLDSNSFAKTVASSSQIIGNPLQLRVIFAGRNPVSHGVENELTKRCGDDSFNHQETISVSQHKNGPQWGLHCCQLEVSLYHIPKRLHCCTPRIT